MGQRSWEPTSRPVAAIIAFLLCIGAAQGSPPMQARTGLGIDATTEALSSPRLPYELTSLLLDEGLRFGEARPRGRAAPFFLSLKAPDRAESLGCLTAAVYHEARSEGEEGQRAVAQVVLNRVRHPAYPTTICKVVHQGPLRAGGGCQFTFTCDGATKRAIDPAAWDAARAVAEAALAGHVEEKVGLATHYHTLLVRPSWSARLERAGSIGRHTFYILSGKPRALALAPNGDLAGDSAAQEPRLRGTEALAALVE